MFSKLHINIGNKDKRAESCSYGLDHVMAHGNYPGNHFQQYENLLPDGKRNWMQQGGSNKSPYSLEIYGLMQELAATRSTFQEREINTFHGKEFGSMLATRETYLSNKSDLIYTEQGRALESEWNRNEDEFVVTFNSDYEDYDKSQNASCNGQNPKNKETDITQLHSSQTSNKSLRISPELDNEDKVTDGTSSSSDAESDVSNPIESPCVNWVISNQFDTIQAKKKLAENVNSRTVKLDMRYEEDKAVDVIADNNLLTVNVPVSTDSGIFSNSTTSHSNCPHFQDPNTDSELSLYGFGATETQSVNPDILIKMKSLSLDKSRGPFSFLNQLSSLTVPSQKQVGNRKQNRKSKRQKYSRVKYSKAAKGKRKAYNTKTKSLNPGTESVLETETVNSRDSLLTRKIVPLGRPRGRPRKKPKVVNPEVERNKMDEMVTRKLRSQNASCNERNPKNKETDITQLHSSQTSNKSLRISPELDNEDKVTDGTSNSSDADSDVSNPIESPCVNWIISNQFGTIQAKKKLAENVNSRAVGLDMRFEEDKAVDVIADNNLLTVNVPVSTDSGIFSNSTTSHGNSPHLQDPNTDSELSLYCFGAAETQSVNPDIVIKMESLSLDKSRGPFSFFNQLSSLTVPSQKQVGNRKQNRKSKRQKYSRVKYSKAAKGKCKAHNTKTKSLKPRTESVLETETVNSRDSPLTKKIVPLGRPRGRPRKKPKVVNPEVERNEMVIGKSPSLRKNSKCTFARCIQQKSSKHGLEMEPADENIDESGHCGEVKSLISSTVRSRPRHHSMKARYSCTFPQVNNGSELCTRRLLVRLEKLKSAPSRNVSAKCKENKNTQSRLDAKMDSVKPKQRQSRCSSSKCGGIAVRTRIKGYEMTEKGILKNIQNSVAPVVKLVGIASSSENEKVSEFVDQGHSVKRLVNLLESDIKCSPSKRTCRAATCHHDPLVQSEETSKDNTSLESSNDEFHLHFQPKTDSLPTSTSESLTRSIGGVMSYLFGDKLPSACPSGFVINVRMDVEKKKSDNDSSTHSCQCANPLNSTASCHLIKGSDFNICPCLDQMSDEQLSALLRKRIEIRQDINKSLKRRLLANIAQFMK